MCGKNEAKSQGLALNIVHTPEGSNIINLLETETENVLCIVRV